MKTTTLMISRNHILYGLVFQLNRMFHIMDIFPDERVRKPCLIRATDIDKHTNRRINLVFIELINF